MLNSKVQESSSFFFPKQTHDWMGGKGAPGGGGLGSLRAKKIKSHQTGVTLHRFQSQIDILVAAHRECTVSYVGPTFLQLANYFSLEFKSHENETPSSSLPTEAYIC